MEWHRAKLIAAKIALLRERAKRVEQSHPLGALRAEIFRLKAVVISARSTRRLPPPSQSRDRRRSSRERSPESSRV